MNLFKQLAELSNTPAIEAARETRKPSVVKEKSTLGLTLPPPIRPEPTPVEEGDDNTIDADTLEWIQSVMCEKQKLDITPRLATTLASAVSKSTKLTLEWHMVKDLPDFMAAAVRAMSKTLFEPFTRTPTDHINVLMNLNECGPNSQDEINKLFKLAADDGERNTKAEAFFKKAMFEHADVNAYDLSGYTFLFVRDFGGSTAYGWPTQDSK
jgi:hypothetical protein